MTTRYFSVSKNVRKFRVTYDSAGEAFIVHKPDGVNVKHFVAHPDGLHYHDAIIVSAVIGVAASRKGSAKQLEQAKDCDFQSTVRCRP
jgi:hypothetical protein